MRRRPPHRLAVNRASISGVTLAPTVLILAAGQGTRMHSKTPKVLHELCGRPMVLWPVHAALEAGAGKVLVVDSPARALERVLPEGVELAVQPQCNGTGGAVAAAMAQLASQADASRADSSIEPNAPVVVLSGDVPLVSAKMIRELVDAHAQSGAAATMVTTVLDDPSGYGRVVRAAGGAVERVVETKQDGDASTRGDASAGGDASTRGDASAQELEIKEVNTGIFAFDAGALMQALPRLTAENAQGELYLPQVLDILRADGQAVAAHELEDERLVLGVNDRVALAKVRKLAQQAIHERHMRAGVSILDPETTVIDVGVEIGEDTVVEPFTTIKGATRIGRRCTVRCFSKAIRAARNTPPRASASAATSSACR